MTVRIAISGLNLQQAFFSLNKELQYSVLSTGSSLGAQTGNGEFEPILLQFLAF